MTTTNAEDTKTEQKPEFAFSTIDGVKKLPVAVAADESRTIEFEAAPGLYQFSNIVDAENFNWESMYINLTAYNNEGQRTGPWFHELEHANPLVPAWWAYLDGQKLGIWISQRVSYEDIVNKRFRATMAFYVDKPGKHTLFFTPYMENYNIRWASVKLERDPDDILIELPKMTKSKDAFLFSRWNRKSFWKVQKRLLNTSHSLYREPLKRGFDWFSDVQDDWYIYQHVIALIVAEKLDGREGSIEKVIEIIDKYIESPHWNNQSEAGYAHNGDKTAGIIFRVNAMAYHILKDELGEERRKKLLDKLTLQGNRFLTHALINRDGWGAPWCRITAGGRCSHSAPGRCI